jgi:macrolide-specific efflux system membrane fusion protein
VTDPIDPTEPIAVPPELAGGMDEVIVPAVPWWKRKVFLITAAVVVVAGATTGLVLGLTSGSSSPAGLSVTTETVAATTGTLKQTVATSGTIEPASQANLNFAVSGAVTAVDVKAGQTVTVGQVVATVGTAALQDDVDAAQAQVASAEARVSSDESSGAAAAQVDSDEASVTSAESSLTTAQTDLADSSLTSTIAGTVATVSLTVGQQISGTGSGSGGSGGGGDSAASASDDASSTTSSGQVVVIGTDSYLVNTTVDDTEIGQIAEGDQATIVPTGSTTTDYGTVTSIGLIATESSDVATFPVVVTVTGTPTGLYAGSTGDVSIIVKQLNNVIEVPTAAITYSTSGQATVTQVVSGKHVTRDVTVGEAENGETQITKGIASGDKVLERVVTFKAGTGGTGRTGLFGGTGGTGGTGRTGGFGGGGGGFGGGTGGFGGGTGGFGG